MKVMKVYPTLYKRDTSGGIRVWHAEVGHGEYRGHAVGWATRSVSGTQGGKTVTSEWNWTEGKNVGRANATTDETQAYFEVEAEYTKKLKRGYSYEVEGVDDSTKFKPMLAKKYEDEWPKLKLKNPVIAIQPKLDGIRCIARVDGLWSRSGERHMNCRHIEEQLAPFFAEHPSVVLDGEFYNHELRDNFNMITSLVRKTKPTDEDRVEAARFIQYHVYDVFHENDPKLSLITRRMLLDLPQADLPGRSSDAILVWVDTVVTNQYSEIDRLYEKYLSNGYEGQMIRICDMPYEHKRSKGLLKRKEFLSEEFEVVSILEGQGNWQGCVKHFELKLKDGSGRTCNAGVKGDMGVLKKMWEEQDKPDWVTLQFFTPTPDGIPRFPVVTDWGKGKRKD